MDGFAHRLPPELPDPAPPRSRLRLWIGQIGGAGLIALTAVAWTVLSIVPLPALEHAAARIATERLAPAGSSLLREVWSVVSARFYDPDLHGVDPEAIVERFARPADQADSPEQLAAVINTSLAELGASHTRLFTPSESAFYEVLDIFNPSGLAEGQVPGQPRGPVSYVGVGCVTTQIEGCTFVSDVYPTGPADRAGLRVGDEILSAAGTQWSPISPFEGRAGEPVPLIVRREASASPTVLEVTPERIRPRTLYLRALKASATLLERDGALLAYVRVRSYAHQSYHEALVELMNGHFAGADGLVLDLRGGWGGARPEYTDAFNPAHPRMEMRSRADGWGDVSRVWDKPLVVLVDEGTRSGKEVLTDALQRAGIATVVGTPTAGAVLGGSIFPMGDGSILMVAVTDVRIDGRRLERHPIQPDHVVARPIPYCGGADPQLDAAYRVLAERIRDARPL